MRRARDGERELWRVGLPFLVSLEPQNHNSNIIARKLVEIFIEK